MAHRELARLRNRQGRRFDAAASLQELCRQGNIEEIELLQLVRIAYPLAPLAGRPDAEPIGGLGRARLAMGQAQWDLAITELTAGADDASDETALLGRLYALQSDAESLASWAAQWPADDDANPDALFAVAQHHALSDDPRSAVLAICRLVRRDPTDADAYRLLGQSLAALGLEKESEASVARVEQLARTQELGTELATSANPTAEQITELADLLEQLRRPFESVAWQAIAVAYRRSSMPPAQVRQLFAQINQRRMELIESQPATDSDHYLTCGVDPETLAASDSVSTDNP
jgi:hypothetical protein